MRFVIRDAAWNEMTNSPTGLVGRDLSRRGRALSLLAKRQVGKKTYALHNSIHYRVVSSSTGLIATVGSSNRVALMHHRGTRPHIILPKRSSTLRFKSRGRIVYAKVVHHPGTKPNKYLTDNLRKVID